MVKPQLHMSVTVGDLMPRITLPLSAGGLFDSWDPMKAGQARVYWLGSPPAVSTLAPMVDALTACETLLHIVSATPPPMCDSHSSWLLDRAGELERAFEATGPLAILVDSGGRVVVLLPAPQPNVVADVAAQLHASSLPAVVRAKAPALMLERVAEPAFCQTLIEYWQRGKKLANSVSSDTGNVINADLKRRQDVQLDDPKLFAELRDRLVRRVLPAMLSAFHARINVMEAPLIGCYDDASRGWFRRHRDNTSSHNAHRHFALTLNLNVDDEYDGGEVRFPEYGRELYRPAAGGVLVFSCSLLHEVNPVTRGRRFGAFTFLSPAGPGAISGPKAGWAPAMRR